MPSNHTNQTKPPEIGRSQNVQDAPIQKLLAEVEIPNDVVSLGQGVPFFGPPAEAITAATNALSDECCYRYTEDAGLLSLREVIARKLKTENKIAAEPENNIMVTSGGNQAFINVLMAITDIGDEVILLTPYYFNHLMALQFTGCKPVFFKTNASYQPEPEKIFQRFTKKTKAIITISPNNPTGAVYSKSVLEEINKFCADQNIYHINELCLISVRERNLPNNPHFIHPLAWSSGLHIWDKKKMGFRGISFFPLTNTT